MRVLCVCLGNICRSPMAGDFHAFDLIVAMDAANLAVLERRKPAGARAEIRLFHPDGEEIPDPYYGGPADYEHALDMVEESAVALVTALSRAP